MAFIFDQQKQYNQRKRVVSPGVVLIKEKIMLTVIKNAVITVAAVSSRHVCSSFRIIAGILVAI